MVRDGGRNADADRFFQINSQIRAKISALLDKTVRWRNYILSFYAWIPPFSEMLSRLDTWTNGETSVREYLNSVSSRGLYLIDEKKKSLDPIYEGNKRKLFLPNNTLQNRKLAAEYLKNSLSKIEQNSGKPGVLVSNLKDIINEGIDGLSKYIAPKDAASSESVYSQFQKMLDEQTETLLEILAGLLIYAQTGYTVTNGWAERHPSVLPNIYMGTKKEIQEKFSLQSRYQGASKLVIINFAGTSFLSGRLVDSTVDSNWKSWFHNTMQGATEIQMVLTKPGTAAAKDAERYKMRPKKLECELEQLIANNLDTLRRETIQYPNRNFKVYLTTISLPCAYIKAEFEEDHDLDNIKVDLYLPTFGEYKQVGNGKYKLKNNEDSDDSVRQSFMLFRKEVPELYEAFSKNINDILLHAEEISFHTEEENDDEI